MTGGILNYNISDHLPVYIIRKKRRNIISKIEVEGRSYLRYDKAEFLRILAESYWTTFDESEDPNQLWGEMENNIRAALDRMCPVRKLIVPKYKPDWLTPDIIQLMRKRDKAYLIARRTGAPVPWRKARFLRNRVKNVIKQYKCNKIQNELNQNVQNPKKFWNNIRSLIPSDKGQEVRKLTDSDTGEFYEGEKLATHINSFFANIGTKLALDITNNIEVNHTTLLCAPMNNDSDGITNEAITAQEIQDVLKVIDVNKSSAITNVRSHVIVDACHSEIERFVKLSLGR